MKVKSCISTPHTNIICTLTKTVSRSRVELISHTSKTYHFPYIIHPIPTQTAFQTSAYRSFPGSRFLSYSLRSAIVCAMSSPKTSAIHAYARSVPAEIPELVQIFPSTTHRALATQFTFGCKTLTYTSASATSSTTHEELPDNQKKGGTKEA